MKQNTSTSFLLEGGACAFMLPFDLPVQRASPACCPCSPQRCHIIESLSDIGAFYVPDQAGKSLMNDEVDQLWDNSPLKYAKNVVTPTLFIQSERDFRCPREETFQMFYQLIKRGIPTKVLYFMGENHGLCRRGAPQNRAARILEIAHWFSQYLFNTKTEE